MRDTIQRHKEFMYAQSRVVETCTLHEGPCCPRWSDPVDVLAQELPLKISMAGTSCQPWSQFGGRQGIAHPATPAWFQYEGELSTAAYDIAFIENSSLMPQDVLFQQAQSRHTCLTAVYGPDTIGFFNHRERRRGACINDESLVWLGSTATDQTDPFLEFFAAHMAMDMSSLVGLDEQSYPDTLRKHLNRGKRKVAIDEFTTFENSIPAGQKELLNKYRLIHAEGRRNSPLSGMMIADISQDASKRCRCGPVLPALAVGSCMVSIDSAGECRLITPGELSFSQGWPALEGLPYHDCLINDISVLSANAQARMLGNGMHLAAESAWFLFILSHVARREQLKFYSVPCAFPLEQEIEEADLPWRKHI
jgi:hypothetical protein